MEPTEHGNIGVESGDSSNVGSDIEPTNVIDGNVTSDSSAGDELPVKRGRGRPRKTEQPRNPADGLADGTTTAGGSGNGRATRGRPRKESGKALSNGIDVLAAKIYGAHLMLALATKRPELTISEKEAADLADAVLLVGREYDVKLTGKTAATLNLAVTAGIIYGQKAFAIYMTNQNASKPAQPATPAPAPAQSVKPINWG